jgi:hypothetical protein
MLRPSFQKIQLRGVPDKASFFSRSPWGNSCYLRITVTQAVPIQRTADIEPDPSWRDGDKIFIKGVSLRARIDYSVTPPLILSVNPLITLRRATSVEERLKP